MSNTKPLTKQQVLDKTPESNEEAALQNMLQVFSKTKLEQMRRTFNEMNNIALYKTQLRSLPFISILEGLQKAVELNKTDKDYESK